MLHSDSTEPLLSPVPLQALPEPPLSPRRWFLQQAEFGYATTAAKEAGRQEAPEVGVGSVSSPKKALIVIARNWLFYSEAAFAPSAPKTVRTRKGVGLEGDLFYSHLSGMVSGQLDSVPVSEGKVNFVTYTNRRDPHSCQNDDSLIAGKLLFGVGAHVGL